jgi:RNA polymerase sigma-70 factor (ECF subfamily)
MPSEQELERALEAARDGAEWAWREIYDSLAPAVIGYLRARGAAEPEDLAGEVFVQVVRDLPAFDGDARGFRSWAFTIARNRLLDDARRRARRPAVSTAPSALESAEVGGDVVDDALARLDLQRVTAILATLSEDQRDVLLLRVVGDLTVEEVARVISKRPGAVKQLQRRGLAAVRKQLEREGALE